MIESTNPEIDVNELMERVRAEAARIRERPRRVRRAPIMVPPALPPIAVLPPVPTVQIPQPINPKKERLDQLLENARSKTQVSSVIPKFLRGLFRRQGAYNTSVLESLGVLAQSSVELNKRVREIALCLERFNGWLLALNQHREADAKAVRSSVGDDVRDLRRALEMNGMTGSRNDHQRSLTDARRHPFSDFLRRIPADDWVFHVEIGPPGVRTQERLVPDSPRAELRAQLAVGKRLPDEFRRQQIQDIELAVKKRKPSRLPLLDDADFDVAREG